MLWIARVGAIVPTQFEKAFEMNISLRSLRQCAILLVAVGMVGNATAQQTTVRLKIIDPANTTHPSARTQQIRNRNVVQFVERTKTQASPQKPLVEQKRTTKAANRTQPQKPRRAIEPTALKIERTQSFQPAGEAIAQVQAREIAPEPSTNRRRVGRVPAVAPISSRVRLVQADDDPDSLLDALSNAAGDDDEFDNLLERARDIVDRETGNTGDMTSDEARRRVQDDLDSLLTDENDRGNSPLNLGDDDESEEGDFDESQYVDPTPDPIRRRVNYGNQPYTLGAIFEDEEYDPQCVQQYCNAVWQCAGGRCQNWWDRMKRNIVRDRMVRDSQCCGMPPSPMANFRCPKVPRRDQNCMGGQQIMEPTLAAPCEDGQWGPGYGEGAIGPMDGDMNYEPIPPGMAPMGTPEELTPQPADLPSEMNEPIGDLDI